MSRTVIALFLALSACSRANLELGTQQSPAVETSEEAAKADAAVDALTAATEPSPALPTPATEEPEDLAAEGQTVEDAPPSASNASQPAPPGREEPTPPLESPAPAVPPTPDTPPQSPPTEPSPVEPPPVESAAQDCPEECPVCNQGECLFCRWQSSCPELGGGTYRCNSGRCERCLEDRDCARGTRCDEELGRCFEYCDSDSHCGQRGQVCRNNICIIPDCVLDTSCDPLSNQLCIDGRCEDYNQALDCSDSPKCPSQFFCKDGRCRPDDDYACLTDLDCPPHEYCQSGRCRQRDDWTYARPSGSGSRRHAHDDAGAPLDTDASLAP